MELKILDKKEEPLLSRTRLEGEVLFDRAVPSIKEVKGNIAKSLGKDEALVDVKGIYSQYGQKRAKIVCYAYESKDVLEKIKVEGKEAKEKAAKKQEGVEAKSEEKPAEKKEQKPDAKEAKQEKAESKKEAKAEEGKK